LELVHKKTDDYSESVIDCYYYLSKLQLDLKKPSDALLSLLIARDLVLKWKKSKRKKSLLDFIDNKITELNNNVKW